MAVHALGDILRELDQLRYGGILAAAARAAAELPTAGPVEELGPGPVPAQLRQEWLPFRVEHVARRPVRRPSASGRRRRNRPHSFVD